MGFAASHARLLALMNRRRDPGRYREGLELVSIFVNYRRADAPDRVLSLFKALQQVPRFDPFMDIEAAISLGSDFVEILNEAVLAAKAFIAVIGPHWLALLSPKTNRSVDYVIEELEAALATPRWVLPVLVDGASMPRPELLPSSIRRLCASPTWTLRAELFDRDLGELVEALKAKLLEEES